MLARLRHVLLFSRDVPKTAEFYSEGLGLKIIGSTLNWVQFDTGGGTPLSVQQIDSEAALSTGYNPILTFNVDDMDETIPSLLQRGATLDGPIKYPMEGKAASVRTPDGHIIGLFEPIQS